MRRNTFLHNLEKIKRQSREAREVSTIKVFSEEAFCAKIHLTVNFEYNFFSYTAIGTQFCGETIEDIEVLDENEEEAPEEVWNIGFSLLQNVNIKNNLTY